VGRAPVKRVAAVATIVVLLSWLLLPIARAYALVSARHDDPSAPSDLVVEDVRFRVGADVPGAGQESLAAWTAHSTHGSPAVVLVHGFKTSRAEMLPWARFLHEAGYNVLLLDTRGSGRSDGAVIGLGAGEASDIRLAVEVARGEFGTAKVAVLGISLGAGAAILAAADDPNITAVIADSAWTDQDLQLARLGFIDVAGQRIPLSPLGVPAVNAMVGADVTKARPLAVVGRIAPRPILLIHSADDENATTPLAGAQKLYDAAGRPKELWIAPRGGHVGAINAFPDEYRSRVLAFLASSLR
jgi:pimeloyl-ACP methyl ester carboxylesterase